MMKKITLLLCLLTAYFGYAQPTTNASTPTNEMADVISIFSDAYSDVATNFNPNWGQSGFGTTSSTFDPTGGGTNFTLAYTNFNYQGTEITTQNASDMEFLHVDIWTAADPGTSIVQVSPINNGTGAGEILVTINHTAGAWTSVDIPKSSFTGMTWDSVFQLKFAANGAGSATPIDIYVDNVYFWKTPVDPSTDATLSDLQIDAATIAGFGSGTTSYTYAVAPGIVAVPQITLATPSNAGASSVITQASAIPGTATVAVTASNGTDMLTYSISIFASGPPSIAPVPPNRAPAEVTSIFSDVYTDIAIDTYDTSWCPGTTIDQSISGNAIKKVSGLGCEGVEFISGRFDATAFTYFHIDIFTESATADKSFNIKLSNWDNGTAEANAIEFSTTNISSPALTNPNPGTWISLDIPLSSFTAGSRNDIAQFIITSDLGTIWYDNLYFHQNTVLSTQDFNKATFKAYPNPTQDSWTVKTQNIKIESITVFNVIGKQVLTMSPNTIEAIVDGSSLKTGLYFAQIKTENDTSSIKLVKK